MIVVTGAEGSRGNHASATGWHVDELGDLHIRKTGGGNLATYARGTWVSVISDEAEPLPRITPDLAAEIERALTKHQRERGLSGRMR